MPVGGKYESCCVVVRNMQRCLYAVPSPSVFPPNTIAELEQLVSSDQPGDKGTFRVKLQVRIISTPNFMKTSSGLLIIIAYSCMLEEVL